MEIKEGTDPSGDVEFRDGMEYMGEFDEGSCFRLKFKNGLS